MQIAGYRVSPLDFLHLGFPAAIILKFSPASDGWVFVMAGMAVIPLAGVMGTATEHLAGRFGPGIGGLLNATFGNAAELIIAALALQRGLNEVVKASITGSILGNILLVLGISMLAGGLKHQRQTFNKTAAGLGATLLGLSAVGLVVPALFLALTPARVRGGSPDIVAASHEHFEMLTVIICVVLMAAYVMSLVFSLKTHSHLFAAKGSGDGGDTGGLWSVRKTVLVLLGATAGVAVMAEMLVGAVEHTAEAWGMPHVFVGVILVAVIGNAAEHAAAVMMAMKNKMDLSINIAVGSSIQIALFVAPLLVFLSYVLGPPEMALTGGGTGGGPMLLDFTTMEVAAVVVAVAITGLVAHDGESHWMEGVMLLAVYVILGSAFYFMPG